MRVVKYATTLAESLQDLGLENVAIIALGSWARGTLHEDSDLDALLICDGSVDNEALTKFIEGAPQCLDLCFTEYPTIQVDDLQAWYQRCKLWQKLILPHACPVCGNTDIIQKFNAVRFEVLSVPPTMWEHYMFGRLLRGVQLYNQPMIPKLPILQESFYMWENFNEVLQ